MNVAYSWSLFLLGEIIILLKRHNFIKGSSKKAKEPIVTALLEEESLNVFLMVFLLPAGVVPKLMIHCSFSLWSVMSVAEMANGLLEADPETIGLASLKPVIDCIVLSKVELSVLKNLIEITLGLLSVPFVFMAQTAIIFPILYFQYIRIKYISSSFCKAAFSLIHNDICKKYIPAIIYDSTPMVMLLNWLCSYVEFADAKDGNP